MDRMVYDILVHADPEFINNPWNIALPSIESSIAYIGENYTFQAPAAGYSRINLISAHARLWSTLALLQAQLNFFP